MARPTNTIRTAALKAGYRSGLEHTQARELEAAGISFEYEKLDIPFTQPEIERTYTPDFVLLDNGIVVETKGIFDTQDRKKILLVRAQYPALDLRFVFSSSRHRISKKSKTTYAMWCNKHCFPFANKTIPASWLDEPPSMESLELIHKLRNSSWL